MKLFLAIACCLTTTAAFGADGPIDFNRDIRPILSENCFFCHGQDANHRQADLRLDERAAAVDSGAIVPGDAESSEVIDRIFSEDADCQMPPPDSQRRLTPEQKKLLARWVDEDAKYEVHWAYVAPVSPEIPRPEPDNWTRNPIDHFVLEKLQCNGLQPSPEADRATLIKRLCIDLVGLPPTTEEVDAFVTDPDPQAYEHLVDRLLASQHFGECMALPWLDAARYADSNGFQQDGDTWQWIWRDWVVRALNEDLPFDQFSIWQLAGDLLPDATEDQMIASAFNRNHLLNGEGGAIKEEQRYIVLFDRIDTTATNWLGLTMACAQCHDHKYDPITQRDYYSLLDAFNRVPEAGTPGFRAQRIRLDRPFIELPTPENQKQIAKLKRQIEVAEAESAAAANAAFEGWRLGVLASEPAAAGHELPKGSLTILGKLDGERTDDERKTLDNELRKHFDRVIYRQLAARIPASGRVKSLRKQLTNYSNYNVPRVMVMSDASPRDTHILDRGAYLSPLEKVTFATPEFLPRMAEDLPHNRLGFAQWLFAPSNPLTARVQVNRIWHHLFGTGLVKTSEDFGVQSEYPVHRELLDWLAVEFRKNNWSIKAMYRLIVTSATYRQSSRVTPDRLQKDAENRLMSRGSRFRMPAMILRDWALAASGLLQSRIGGAPVYPYQPEAIWETLAITKERDFTYPASTGDDLYRRSLYTFWRRTVAPANMFDASNRQACRVRSSTTSTPLHALTMLNDPTWVESARVLAEQSMKHDEKLQARLTYAFRRVICRIPREEDLAMLQNAYEKQLNIYQSDSISADKLLAVGAFPRDLSLDKAEHAALTSVCLAIFNLDEAMTRE